ncbi:MAG: protein kinase domain-containing protein, partial [Rhodopila sp.]
QQEIQAAGRLNHPNIVAVYDFIETDREAWIIMERIEGGSLKDLLDRDRRLPVSDVVRMMSDILSALAYSHAHHVVHRDIKPTNLLLTPDRRVKVVDFGVAHIENSELTKIGTVLGTAAYMAPEQQRGEQVDHRADIWSAGVVLYELLTGEKPYPGAPDSVVHKVLNTELQVPTRISKATLRAFDAVVARALAKRREDRFQTAEEFSAAIHAAVQSDTKWKFWRPSVKGALVGIGAAALITGIVTGAILSKGSERSTIPLPTVVFAKPNGSSPQPGSVSKGTQVRVFARSDQWLQIGNIADEKPWGWVNPQLETFTIPLPTVVFAEPNGSSAQLGSVSKGTQVRVFARSDQWLQIGNIADEKPSGWVNPELVTCTMPLPAVVFDEPNGSSPQLGSVSKGTQVRVFAWSGQWLQIGNTADEKPSGWVNPELVTCTMPLPATVVAGPDGSSPNTALAV